MLEPFKYWVRFTDVSFHFWITSFKGSMLNLSQYLLLKKLSGNHTKTSVHKLIKYFLFVDY